MIQPGSYLLNRYEILSRIGSGGMADVYKALDHRLNRNVAIKVLKAEFSKDQSFVAKFQAEAQATAGLTHPNIVNVYDVAEEFGMYFIVMELVEGITLKEFIRAKGKLPANETVGISIQIAQGLDAAHQRGIVHRDIKPQNIILSKEGAVKVADFGIAKAVTSNTITSNAVGSVHYISPEQARGGYSDAKSDIYSLGVTMYEMLCGHVPFTGDSTVNVALQHIQQEPVPLRSIDPTIPESLEKIVSKCMQKKPERRYHNVQDLIADLKESVRTPSGDFVTEEGLVDETSSTVVLTEAQLNDIKKNAGVSTGEAAAIAIAKREEQERPDKAGGSGKKKNKDDDYDDDDDVDPKVEKLMIGGGIAAAVILILVILFLLSRTIGWFHHNDMDDMTTTEESTTEESTTEESTTEESTTEEELLIPADLIGREWSVVRATLDSMGLKVVQAEDEYSDTYDEGLVIKMDPEEGSVVHPGDTVRVTVSAGKEEIELRDLTGYTESDATSYLTKNGLLSSIQREESDTVESGKVISTTPAAGTMLSPGDSVTIIVSSGRGQTLVPSLIGLTQEEAENELKNADLELGTVTLEYSERTEAGRVISQSTSRNSKVEKGSKIDIVVSRGKESYTAEIYVGIENCPFDESQTEGLIDIILQQEGMDDKVIFSEYCTADSFPISFPVESSSNASAHIYLKLDGEDIGEQIAVNFR